MSFTTCPFCGQSHPEDASDDEGGCVGARGAGHLDPWAAVQVDDPRALEEDRAYRQSKGRR